MNLPNQITLSRLALSVAFVAVMSLPFAGCHSTALVLFLVASATDWLDGHLARKHGLVTNFGILMDSLIDKILITSGFVMLIPPGLVPAWVVIVIVGREFLVTGLRLIASSRGVVLPSERLGKLKMVAQVATVVFFLVLLMLPEWRIQLSPTSLTWSSFVGSALLGLTVVLTLVSGLGYVWRNRELLV